MNIAAELAEGVVLKGEREQVNTVLDILEDGDVELSIITNININTEFRTEKWWANAEYDSRREGLVKVAEMNTGHIANAAAKLMREVGVRGGSVCNGRFDGDVLFAVLRDPELRALVSELCERMEKAD